MSQLNEFTEHVLQDAQLQARLKTAESDEVLVERVLAEGKALGYDLDASEVRQRLTAVEEQENTELSEAELRLVSGGAKSDLQIGLSGLCW